MRRALVAAVATALVLGGATAALASSHPLNVSTAGASFSGYWDWYPRGVAHGGWHFWGTITDTICSDGDNVYSKVKVEGYSPNSFYGTQCSSKYQNYEVYDYQALITTHAEYSVCRDRSFPYSDNCSATIYMDR